jgi:hydroxyethylthiazole kinase-like uncharacterized protein yjeF
LPPNKSLKRITRALLNKWPLPDPSSTDDKDARGRVLVVGGQTSLPGAVILAGIASLRAGAGKLQIATGASLAPSVGIAVPECMAIALPENGDGTISPRAALTLTQAAKETDAVLIGPGMMATESTNEFVAKLLGSCHRKRVVLDAGALDMLSEYPDTLKDFNGNAIITPHAGEMARVLGIDIEEVTQHPISVSIDAAQTLGAHVVLKGSTTFVATPDGELFRYDAGDVGLATSGSGDTLAGVVAGLLARDTHPLHAALWAVFLHGAAGNALARKIGRIGYLARELLDEIPAIMNRV